MHRYSFGQVVTWAILGLAAGMGCMWYLCETGRIKCKGGN